MAGGGLSGGPGVTLSSANSCPAQDWAARRVRTGPPRWRDADLMAGQRRRRWPAIKPTSRQGI